jgi:hypothetical protein
VPNKNANILSRNIKKIGMASRHRFTDLFPSAPDIDSDDSDSDYDSDYEDIEQSKPEQIYQPSLSMICRFLRLIIRKAISVGYIVPPEDIEYDGDDVYFVGTDGVSLERNGWLRNFSRILDNILEGRQQYGSDIQPLYALYNEYNSSPHEVERKLGKICGFQVQAPDRSASARRRIRHLRMG